MPCPRSDACVFFQSVEPSIIKRVRYHSVYSYCRGGQHEQCALYRSYERGIPVARNLMPGGSIGDYLDNGIEGMGRKFLIIEDSPVFSAFAFSTISSNYPGAHIVRTLSYDAAVSELSQDWAAIICGFGLGGDKTAHDVRKRTAAPMVVLTGRPDITDLPVGSRRVRKGEGPEALAAALRACLG